MICMTGPMAAVVTVVLGAAQLGGPDAPGVGSPSSEAGRTIVVSAEGQGDFTTIGEAVDVATDGDTVLLRPGTYAEAVNVDDDVIVTGDGRPDAVVLAFGDGRTPVVTMRMPSSRT